VAGGEGGAAGGEDERVGGGQVGFLDGREGATGQAFDHRARLADGADVARGGDHGHVPGCRGLECAVQAIDLGRGVAVLAACLAGGADRDHASLGRSHPDRGDGGRDRVGGVLQRCRFDEDDGDRGARRDRVHVLGVEHLLAVGEPWER